MSLREMMEEYQSCEEIANRELLGTPTRTLPALQMRQREAQDRLVTLTKEYGDALLKQGFAIFTKGDPENQGLFAAVAKNEVEIMAVPADSLYQFIADEVEPGLGSRHEFGTSQLAILVRTLTLIAVNLGLDELPTPNIDGLTVVATREALVDYIRLLVRKSSGDAMNQAWIRREVTKQGLQVRYSRERVPVIFTGAAEEEIAGLKNLFPSGLSFEVEATDENVTPEGIIKVFAEIKKSLPVLPKQ